VANRVVKISLNRSIKLNHELRLNYLSKMQNKIDCT